MGAWDGTGDRNTKALQSHRHSTISHQPSAISNVASISVLKSKVGGWAVCRVSGVEAAETKTVQSKRDETTDTMYRRLQHCWFVIDALDWACHSLFDFAACL